MPVIQSHANAPENCADTSPIVGFSEVRHLPHSWRSAISAPPIFQGIFDFDHVFWIFIAVLDSIQSSTIPGFSSVKRRTRFNNLVLKAALDFLI